MRSKCGRFVKLDKDASKVVAKLVAEKVELTESLKHVLQIIDDSVSVQDLHQFEDDRIKKAVELIGGW